MWSSISAARRRIVIRVVVNPGGRRTSNSRARAEELKVGQPVPDYTLTDQTGRPFSLASQRGRVVLVNFLYTRWPASLRVCPRLAASFASLQRRFPTEDLMLVSITLDPTFDTPEVLAGYAATMRARVDRWRFLTGDTAAVARRFGLVHWAEEGVIVPQLANDGDRSQGAAGGDGGGLPVSAGTVGGLGAADAGEGLGRG
jgi:protein SCO1/2